jgi:ankyrin repeat protein
MENILEAVRQGDEGQVAKMLDENPRLLDRMTSYQEWPLAEAAKYGQLGVVKLLAQRGANLNEAGRFSKTALHWAVEGGHEEVVAFLLSKDVRPNDCDTSSKTPLEWACERGYMGVVRMLVQHLGQQGMDAAHTATMGLRYAARAGQKSMVKYLLGEGAQLKGDRGHDWTALIEASARGHLGVVQMLVEHMGGQGLEERDRMGNTALYHAARWGHKEVVGFLLSQGAQTTKPDLWGRTALICASMKGHLGVVQALLQHMEGQRLDERDMDGSTALYHAAFNGHELVVGFLLSQGAQANSSNNKGVTPLMGASENGHLGVVRLLVQHTGGQGLNAMDTERGWTALSWAASREHEDVMRYLLLSGADPTINDNEEEGPPLRQFYSFNRFSRERRASLEAVLEVRRSVC